MPVSKDVPQVSVVIPVRDRRKDVLNAVASVLAQTVRDFELVVVDDGSRDGSGDAALSHGDPRVRLVRTPGLGVSAARNLGVREARAPWVGFLDSDDLWRPRFLEATLALARRHPSAALVFCNCLSVRDGQPWLRLPFESPELVQDYVQFVLDQKGRGFQTSSALVNRAAFQASGGFAVGVHRSEDVDLWLRLALTAPFGCVPEVLSEFHNEHSGVTRQLPEPFYPEIVRTLRRVQERPDLPAKRLKQLRRLEALALTTYIRDLSDYGRRSQAREVLVKECRWTDCLPADLARTVLNAIGRDEPPPPPRARRQP